uniref:Glycosyltransferase n=2 Tax=Setaria italica TaxID=4555 RepID=K3ZSY1_SETIT
MPPPVMAGESSMDSVHTSTGGRRRRVLFFPLPYQGHLNPMFQLAGILHSRGFAVTIFHTHFNALDASLHPAYDFVPVPDGCPPADTPGTLQVTLERVLAVNRACEAPFRERLAALLEQQREDDVVACLVADAHLLTLLGVARGLGVPTLVLRTGSAAGFRCFTAFPMLCDKGYQPAQESRLDAPVKELLPYRVRDLLSTTAAGHAVVSEAISRMVTAAATSSGLILNTFDALEAAELAALRRDLAVPVFDVGPLHKLSPAAANSLLRQDHGCLDWLDTQAPASVLYVSFGSLASLSATDLVEIAWGIANSGLPFLWVLRPGLVRGAPASQDPPPLPDGFDAATRGRGTVVSWAPQEEVLAHPAVGGFWTHCGWNSTLEGVCAGVPMLCRPCFGDQMGNARYVDHVWRVGVTLEGELERGKVEAAIAAVMHGGGEPGEGMRRRALELKSRAAESIGEAGSSCLNVDKLVSHIMGL